MINSKEGYVVTNSHVVRMAGRNADEIMVKLNGEENSKGHPARIIGVDEVTDVALLKLDSPPPGLKQVPLGDSDKTKVGELVLAIGNPYGHTNSVTQGIVSALGRSLEGARAEFMQTSASINPGNSGGPLINMDGEVIGINTAIDPRAQGIGFAIPINGAKNVIEQLAAKGKVTRAWMGVVIQDVSEDIARYMRLKSSSGVLVKEVVKNQPADLAGVEVLDVITRIDGREVKNTRDLYRYIDQLEAGKTATLEVSRDNRTRTLQIRFGESPAGN
ncbi:MAG: trypsin-like serine protease [Calothrix sp. SM1_5_4]|nr:trypsin-like serine protease [Calothrix sp. SM1_5_4]